MRCGVYVRVSTDEQRDNGYSTRGIATVMRDNKAYLKTGKWTSDRVYKILTNSIHIGILNMVNIVENHKIY